MGGKCAVIRGRSCYKEPKAPLKSNNRDNMKREIADLRESLILIGTIIILVGSGTSILIYQSAGNDSNGVLGYEIIDGTAYPIAPEDSKVYRRDLEHFGGKAAIVVDDFSRWFIGLWHGKTLAFTVVFISIFISLLFFFIANRLPFILKSNADSENNRE